MNAGPGTLRVAVALVVGALVLAFMSYGPRETNRGYAPAPIAAVPASNPAGQPGVEIPAEPIPDSAGGPRPLFRFVNPLNASLIDAALPAPSREVRHVAIDRAWLGGKQSPFWRDGSRVEIPLPRGGSVTVALGASEMLGADRWTNAGRIEGRAGAFDFRAEE